MQKVKIKGHSVLSWELKQMDGHMDKWRQLYYLPC